MYIPILQTGNFACLAIKTRVSFELHLPIKLTDGVYVTTEIPFQIDEFWKENIGKLESNHITGCNLFNLAQTASPPSSIWMAHQDAESDLNKYNRRADRLTQRKET